MDIHINKSLQYTLEILVLSVLVYFTCIHHIDKLPIRLWDEGLNAVNAYEMNLNGNYIVRYFEGKPDMWNVKSPFLTWCQVLSIKILGVNELAIRLPSIIAVLSTIFSIIYFCTKVLNKKYYGYLAALILISSPGYVRIHVARSGDHDALLILFTTLFLFSFYKFYTSKSVKYIYSSSLLLIIGVLTKSIVILIFLPGIVIFLLLEKELFTTLKNKHIWYSCILFIGFVIGFYWLQEVLNPGCLSHVWNDELIPRFTNNSKNYNYRGVGDMLYYSKLMLTKHFIVWSILLPVAIYMIYKKGSTEEKLFSSLILSSSLFFFLTISIGCKNDWYNAPIIPLFSIVTSIGLYHILKIIPIKPSIQPIGILIIIICLSFYPLKSILQKTFNPKDWDLQTYSMSYYLKEKIHSKEDLNFKIVYTQFKSHLIFYRNILNENPTNNIQFIDKEKINSGDKVLCSEQKVKNYISENFNIKILEKHKKVTLFLILEDKQL